MRQWLVNPQYLCDKHLMGEHVEHHMMIGSIQKKRSITGFIEKGLMDPKTIYKRHEELVAEFIARGFNHKSDLPIITIPNISGNVNIEKNILELQHRCVECNKRIQKYK